MKIEIPLFDLKYQKNIRQVQHYIELNERCLKFVIDCYLDQHPREDDDLGITKEDQYCNQVDYIKKDSIYWIKSKYEQEYDIWQVFIYYGNEDTYAQFETEKKAKEFERQIIIWLGW